MKFRTILIVGLALVFGLSAAMGVSILLRGQTQAAAAPPVETVEVVVANADFGRWDKITPAMVNVRQIPKEMVPKGAITRVEDALDRVALLKCSFNEILLDSKLAPKGSGSGLVATIPAGKRAFTIKTAKISGVVAGLLMPGDRVDVLLTVNAPSSTKQGTLTLTLLTDIEVIAVDAVIEPPSDKKISSADARSVTLMVTPEQASKLALGENKGSLHLSLRNPHDEVVVPGTKVTLKDIGLVEERTTKETAKETPVKEKKENPPPPPVVAPPPQPAPPLAIRIRRNNVESKVYLGNPSPNPSLVQR